MKEMKNIELNDIKKIGLEILTDIDRVCNKYNIKYSLAYGTLIGAARHKGFIPWDDDIDIIMFRKDWNKLLEHKDELSNNHEIVCVEVNDKFTAPLAKIIDNETVLRENGQRGCIDLGIYVDVFIYDYLPQNNLLRNIIFGQAYIDQKIYGFSTYYPRTNLKIELFLRNIAMNKRWGRKAAIRMTARGNKRKSDNYIGNIMFSVRHIGRQKEYFKTEELNDYIRLEFEGHKFWTFSCYKKLLHIWYDNWKELPPIEKQVTHHDFVVFYK